MQNICNLLFAQKKNGKLEHNNKNNQFRSAKKASWQKSVFKLLLLLSDRIEFTLLLNNMDV